MTILYPYPGMTKEHAIKVWEQRKAIGMTKLSKKEWIKKYLVKKYGFREVMHGYK